MLCLVYLTLSSDESTQVDNWFMPSEDTIATGVCLRVKTGFFRVFPYENPALIPFEAAVRGLNPVVAVKLRSAAVHATVCKMYASCLLTYFIHS